MAADGGIELGILGPLAARREGDTLRLSPCLPADWPGFRLRYRYRETLYRIAVTRGASGQAEHTIPLLDDRRVHDVEVTIPG